MDPPARERRPRRWPSLTIRGRLRRSSEAFKAGAYELTFRVADYFKAKGVALDEPAFLDIVPLRFGIADADQHYHVPLLVSPFAYSTYRGS